MAYVQVKQYDPSRGYYWITKWVADTTKTATQPTRYTQPAGTIPQSYVNNLVKQYTPQTSNGITTYPQVVNGSLTPNQIANVQPQSISTSTLNKYVSSGALSPFNTPTGTVNNTQQMQTQGQSLTDNIRNLLSKVYASGTSDITKLGQQVQQNKILNAIPGGSVYSFFRQALEKAGVNKLPNIGVQAAELPTNVGKYAQNLNLWGGNTTTNKLGNPVNKTEKVVNKLPTPSVYNKNVSNTGSGLLPGAGQVLGVSNNAGSAYNQSVSAYNKLASGDPMTDLKNYLKQVDDQLAAQLDNLYTEAYNGNISAEEYTRKSQEAQQAAQDAVYNQLIASQESELPLLQKEYEAGKAEAEGGLTEQKLAAENLKNQTKNVYEEAARKIVGNKNISQGNLRNVFAAANTAGSSFALAKEAQLENEAGTNVAMTENEKASKIADIDNKMLSLENEVKNALNKLLLEKQKQENTIKNNINMSKAKKDAATNELNANLYNQLVSLQQGRQSQLESLAAAKFQIYSNSAELLKNSMVSDTLYNRIGSPSNYQVPTEQSSTNRITQKDKTGRWVKQFDPQKGYIWYNLDTGETKPFA